MSGNRCHHCQNLLSTEPVFRRACYEGCFYQWCIQSRDLICRPRGGLDSLCHFKKIFLWIPMVFFSHLWSYGPAPCQDTESGGSRELCHLTGGIDGNSKGGDHKKLLQVNSPHWLNTEPVFCRACCEGCFHQWYIQSEDLIHCPSCRLDSLRHFLRILLWIPMVSLLVDHATDQPPAKTRRVEDRKNYIISLEELTEMAKVVTTKRCCKQPAHIHCLLGGCNLCLWEKHFIICKPKMSTLNNRSELIPNCRHSKKFLLTTVFA